MEKLVYFFLVVSWVLTIDPRFNGHCCKTNKVHVGTDYNMILGNKHCRAQCWIAKRESPDEFGSMLYMIEKSNDQSSSTNLIDGLVLEKTEIFKCFEHEKIGFPFWEIRRYYRSRKKIKEINKIDTHITIPKLSKHFGKYYFTEITHREWDSRKTPVVYVGKVQEHHKVRKNLIKAYRKREKATYRTSSGGGGGSFDGGFGDGSSSWDFLFWVFMPFEILFSD